MFILSFIFFCFFLGPNVVFQCESTSETHYPSLTSVEAGWPALLTCLTQSFCFVWTLDPIKKLGFCGFSSNLQFQLICKSRKDSWSLCGFHCCSFLFPLVFPLGLITVVISMHINYCLHGGIADTQRPTICTVYLSCFERALVFF